MYTKCNIGCGARQNIRLPGGSLGSPGRSLLQWRGVARPRLAPAPAQASSVAASAVGAAQLFQSGVASLCGAVHASIDPYVLNATVGASFKLFLICTAVGWLLRTGRLPNATATILSQVSFNIFIPCMLFSKVAGALAGQPDASLLLGIVAATLLQIVVGAVTGLLLSPLVDGQYSTRRTIFGWHPLKPAQSASAIAATTARATGVPLAAAALLPRAKPPPEGIRQLVAVACTFGNSFTLPAVFFMTLLPKALADQAMGYAAIYMLAWSPSLWSLGFALVNSGGSGPKASPSQSAAAPAPAAGRGSIGGGQQGGSQLAVASGSGALDVARAPQQRGRAGGGSASGSGRAPHHLWVFGEVARYHALRSLRQFWAHVANPPVLSILAGMAVGLSPLGQLLVAGGAPGALAKLPLELQLAAGVARSAWEVVELLAAGTLAAQTLVLASSLLQQSEGSGAAAASRASSSGVGGEGQAAGTRAAGGWLSTARRVLLPKDALEGRALGVLCLARFVVVPVATLGCMAWLMTLGILPSAAANPVLLFVLAVEAVMPSAQNLTIMLQLSERTRPVAPSFARMLLKLYAYAVLPVTLWVTAFATRLAIPVLR